ncbi:hypothetical protein V6N12_004271 [Hibiscus sabdariffa]|uniref:Uncharacterized protein n=1 Tax=Hibiscus sabdariffa TaxID=183260 RepID=A0ABR2CLG2_9ROSI
MNKPFSSFTNTVKLKNPSITTFSLMINETSRRKSFIESSIKIARLYGFHGLDLCRVEPRNGTNMTSLGVFLDEWPAKVASDSRSSGKLENLLIFCISSISLLLLQCYVPPKYVKKGIYSNQENAAARPSMVEVFNILKNESSVAISTPKQPAYSVTRDDNRKITDL